MDDGQGEAVQLKNYLKQVSKASIQYGTFLKTDRAKQCN